MNGHYENDYGGDVARYHASNAYKRGTVVVVVVAAAAAQQYQRRHIDGRRGAVTNHSR